MPSRIGPQCPITTMANLTDKKEQFVAAAGALATPSKKTFKANLASAAESDWLKILAYGHSGVGKTTALAGLLKTGLRVFVANTDIGGDGLRSVKALLGKEGKTELLENLASFDFLDYTTFEQFTKNPALVEIRPGTDLWAWNPDILVWEGMSNWQERHLGDFVLEQSPSGKSSDLREAGLMADQQDWGAIRKATLRTLDKFLIAHNPNGKRIHKYVTTLEDNSKQDKLTGEVYKGPLIMGAARSYMAPAFDLIIEMMTKKEGKDLKYVYKCGASANALSKRRGLPVEPEEPGDMEALWRKITGPMFT